MLIGFMQQQMVVPWLLGQGGVDLLDHPLGGQLGQHLAIDTDLAQIGGRQRSIHQQLQRLALPFGAFARGEVEALRCQLPAFHRASLRRFPLAQQHR